MIRTALFSCVWFMLVIMSGVNATPNKHVPQGQAVCQHAQDGLTANKIHNAYVQIDRDDAYGSGVLVEYKGEVFVLTAKHVVGDAEEVELSKSTADWKNNVVGDVLFISDKYDLALVQPRATIGTPIEFAPTTAVRGEAVWYCGTTGGLHGWLEKTIVAQPRYRKHKRDMIGVNGNGWYGNSGGGLYVIRDGEPTLIGIMIEIIFINERTPMLAESNKTIQTFLETAHGARQKAQP